MAMLPTDPPPRNAIGVMIRYCEPGSKTPTDVWVDMDKIHGLAWDPPGKPWPKIDEPFDHGKAGINGDNKIDQVNEPTCPGHKTEVKQLTAGTGTGTGVCWWDGNQWICCD